MRPEPQARAQLLDDQAQALLWLYICTLEARVQEVRGPRSSRTWGGGPLPRLAVSQGQPGFYPDLPLQGIERDRRAQAPNNLEEFEVNDLNYEDKVQEDRFLYSNIAFNLVADAGEGCECRVLT